MKKFAASRLYVFLTGLLSLVLIQGCELADPVVNGESGTLKITLSDKMNNSKTIEPSISMTIATYDITGTCSGQADVSMTAVSASQGSVEFEGLASGSWTFIVTGRNSAGTAIGSGQGSVSIIQGQDSALPVIVTPVQGNGTLQLNASWSTGSVGSNPVLTASLTPLGGTAGAISFSINVANGTAAYSNSSIAAGYYTLSLVLTDNGTNCGGATEIVRIAAGQTSAGNILLGVSNHGVINITITQQMNDPVVVSLANTLSSIAAGSSMTVTASVSNAAGVTYYWYIDGVSVSTNTESYTVNGSTLAVGQHRLDVIAITSDNARAGSTTHAFAVTQ